MAFGELFLGFLQPVALGSAAVFVLFLFVHFRTHRRSPVFVDRRTSSR
jgi:hypothetical protein